MFGTYAGIDINVINKIYKSRTLRFRSGVYNIELYIGSICKLIVDGNVHLMNILIDLINFYQFRLVLL